MLGIEYNIDIMLQNNPFHKEDWKPLYLSFLLTPNQFYLYVLLPAIVISCFQSEKGYDLNDNQ